MNSKIKKLIKQMKCHFELDIKKAKANGFEAVMVPLNIDFEVYHVSVNDDEDYLCEIAYECGWDSFILIDFIERSERFINLYEKDAA